MASSSRASGATPRYGVPWPAMVAATCVPWPIRSVASGSAVKLRSAISRPARSGWSPSTPVSTTATVTPAPVYPAAQAVGAPIWAVLRSRVGRRTPSSHTLATPGSASSADQPADAVALGVTAATARTVGRSRVTCKVDTSGARSPARVTMSGTLSRRASS
ncbi:hypothetical protein A6A25_14040 [Saccharothrix sp. CB00851]|nr:hypothetical protein [Saccharothrix sp. CB00851]OKI15429.1 hypothetical protein A6A25_14040 [Saccharothrix sp. CB00851]